MSKKKKVINKDDLRRLMKLEQSSATKKERKIDSPLAKYDSLGQLHCGLCGCKVKTDLLWTAHVSGKTHKQNLALLKEQQIRKNEATVRPPEVSNNHKRKLSDDGTKKHSKSQKVNKNSQGEGLPSNFFDTSSKAHSSKSPKSSSSAGASLGLGDYSSDDGSSEDDADLAVAPPPGDSIPGTSTTGLPADFFDTGVGPSKPSQEKEVESQEEKVLTMAEKLPEGFFDDAKLDAKARQIEYKDKLEEEWELFQKTMKEEHQVSEAIQEEDEEAGQVNKNIDQIDEQIYHWSKVEELHQKKEKVMSVTQTDNKTDSNENSSNSDIDEQEYEEFLDWRSKNV